MTTEIGLTDAEQEHLDSFNERLQLVRDRTRGVAEGWQTGFYLWGEGGISKSWTVQDELKRLALPFKLTNTRLTPKGLFLLLAGSPDMVHVIEDAESLCANDQAASVLRSALWATETDKTQQHKERLITWVTANGDLRITFTGGIILLMNKPLDDIPTLRAVKTRIAHAHLQPTNAEVAALMKSIALKGHRHGSGKLSPAECLEVYEYVRAACDRAGRNYDLRMLVNAFGDRLQHSAGHAETHWQDLVESRLRERVLKSSPTTRAGKIASEVEVALEIDAMPVSGTDKLKLWTERTGKGKSAYYRQLGRAGDRPDTCVKTTVSASPPEAPEDDGEPDSKRSPFDFYRTPEWATKALLDVEDFEGEVLEPCCGDGAISKLLEEAGYEVVSSDLRRDAEVYGEKGVDVLSLDHANNVVTNPPYAIDEKVVEHCLSIATGKVAMLLRLGFLESQGRAELFERYPVARVYVFKKRVIFEAGFKGLPKVGREAHAWLVWDRDQDGPTQTYHI